jgi:guanine nucleotide-binding protein subunit alpha
VDNANQIQIIPHEGIKVETIERDSTLKAIDISKRIDEQLIKEHKDAQRIIKLLLLGPAESGKTTVLKQMKIIHCEGYDKEELLARRPLIFLNVVQSMSQLLHGSKKLGFRLMLENEADAVVVAEALHDPKSIEMGLPDHVYNAVKRLWEEPKILDAYERRSEFHLIDCAK